MNYHQPVDCVDGADLQQIGGLTRADSHSETLVVVPGSDLVPPGMEDVLIGDSCFRALSAMTGPCTLNKVTCRSPVDKLPCEPGLAAHQLDENGQSAVRADASVTSQKAVQDWCAIGEPHGDISPWDCSPGKPEGTPEPNWYLSLGRWIAIIKPTRHTDGPLGISDAEHRIIAVMPLHAITAIYGEQGLQARLGIEISRLDDAASKRQVREALQLAGQLHATDRRQREPYLNHLLRVALRIICQAAASQVLAYEAQRIPALLQTAAYARALAETDPGLADDDAIDKDVEAVLARQRVIVGERKPDIQVIIGEAALRQEVGGPQVLAGQLRLLTAISGRHSVITVRILPFSSGAHAASGFGSLAILQFPETPGLGIVYLGGAAGGVCLEDRADLAAYARVFE